MDSNQTDTIDDADGNFAVGMMWGIFFSIPLWISIFGWVKLIKNFFG